MEQVSSSVTPSASLPAVVRRERGNLLIECVPEEVPPHLSQRLEQYQNTRSCSLEDFHLASAPPSNGSIQGLLVTTRFGETTQVHCVQQPGGYRKQLTFFQEPVGGAAACPNAQAEHRDCFLFVRDVGGTEQYQIYCFDMSTGEYVMLSDGTSKNGFPTEKRRESVTD
ncbi:Peptidase S9, prolyl oligopeptidase [Balamuthia mandrillaris]